MRDNLFPRRVVSWERFKLMRLFKVLFGIVVSLALFNSCTIEKRVHRSGYHVQWKGKEKGKHTKTKHEVAEEKVVAVRQQEVFKEQIERQEVVKKGRRISRKEKRAAKESLEMISTSSRGKKRLNKIFQQTTEQEQPVAEPKEERKVNFLGALSLALLLVSFGGLMPVSLILSIISLAQFSRYPDRYEGRWMSVVALGLSLLILGLIAVAIIGVSGPGPWSIVAIVTLIFIGGMVMFAKEPES